MVQSKSDDMFELYEAFILAARNWSNEWNNHNQISLSPTHVLILELLELDKVKRPSKLAQELHITTGGVTALTNKLVKDGFIKRSHLEDDRRAIVLEITDTGRTLLEEARKQKMLIMKKMFGMLSDSELNHIKEIFKKMNERGTKEEEK
ncbi:MarR family winged helix-turn-helix transcriptional regulator [Bacillus solitudinis]|uniref:MarR family winged helix-turn-helix transcriptional regulator n=1 Tax=Bacillus solitudinis TaxID=2014074 RepID=UPI000C24E789|nr:MarR family transcriptional regulator [Bacillus solitudinis]